MRSFRILAAAWLLAAGLAAPAGAATLNWEGTLSVTLAGVPPAITTGTGVATVNASAGLGHLNTLRLAGGLAAASTLPITDPAISGTLPVIKVQVSLGTGTLKPISGGGPLTANTLPLKGTATLCLFFANCTFTSVIPLTVGGTRGVGIGGSVSGGLFSILVQGAPWTVGTAMITITTNGTATFTTTATGFAHGPASASSTAQVGGAVQLVTPILITSSVGSPIPGFATVRLRFVPEPAWLLTLASGIGGLALLARRRTG